MSDARERLLAEVRAALGGGRPDPAEVAREAAALVPEPQALRPGFDRLSNLERFVARATSERLTATVARVASFAEMPAAVGRYLDKQGLAHDISLVPQPRLTALGWGDIAFHHEIGAEEPVSVGLADWGIAETGTLVFHSSPETPTLFNYLPLHHIAVVEAARILRHLEDYWAEVRGAGNRQPRNVNWITGTSGTADIEAKNIRGAHGPRFLHIVIVGEEKGAPA